MAVEVIGLERTPRKPGLTFLLIPALVLWAAAAATFGLSETLPPAAVPVCAVICLVLGLISALLVIPSSKKDLMLALALGFLGAALGFAASVQMQAGYRMAEAGASLGELYVQQDSTDSSFGCTTLCVARTEDGESCRVRLYTDADERFLAGAVLEASGQLSPLKVQAQGRLRDQGVCAQVSGATVEEAGPSGFWGCLREVRAQAIQSILAYGGDRGSLMAAVVCGYRAAIADDSLYGGFKACGLAHMIAVSGAHTSILLMMLLLVLKALRVPKVPSVFVSIAFVGAYLVFVGFPLSAIRSAVMAVLSLTSLFAGRRSASLNSLTLCIIGFILIDPISCRSISLFLSAGSTLGIVLFASLFASWFPHAGERLRNLLIEPAGLTFSANLLTLPTSAALFSQASLIAPIANILAAPLFALTCTAGFAGCLTAQAVPALAPQALHLAGLSCWPLIALVELLSSIPFASVPCALDPLAMLILSVGASCFLWIWWPRLTKRLLIGLGAVLIGCLAAFILIMNLPRGNTLTALNVGQGDAILVRSGSSAVLVDTGNSDGMLRHELGEAGVYQLDAVIITHPDDDHCASLGSLGDHIEVKRILMAQDVFTCGCAKCNRLLQLADRCSPSAPKQGLHQGDLIQVGSISLEVLRPERFTDEGGNGDSLCLMAGVDVDGDGTADRKALLTGDAEAEQLEAIARSGRLEDVDVLKVGHHGSKVSLSEETTRLLKPEVALISVGEGNRYGHPSEEALQQLGQVGSHIFRTDEDGTVTVTFTEERLTVNAQERSAP